MQSFENKSSRARGNLQTISSEVRGRASQTTSETILSRPLEKFCGRIRGRPRNFTKGRDDRLRWTRQTTSSEVSPSLGPIYVLAPSCTLWEPDPPHLPPPTPVLYHLGLHHRTHLRSHITSPTPHTTYTTQSKKRQHGSLAHPVVQS